jgi:hypothetical protein
VAIQERAAGLSLPSQWKERLGTDGQAIAVQPRRPVSTRFLQERTMRDRTTVVCMRRLHKGL